MFNRGTQSRLVRVAAVGATSMCLIATGCFMVSSSAAAAKKKVTGLPKVIKIHAISDLTGAAALYGQAELKGWDLAVKQINSSGLLGKSKIDFSTSDDTSSSTVAAGLASQAVNGKYAVVISAPASANAVVEAPIFSKAHQVTVFNQAGSSGVLISPYMFRLTPTAANQYPAALQYLQSQNVKSVADIYLDDNPTLTGVDAVVASDASTYGLTDVGHVGITSTTTDVTSAVTTILGFKPGAVAILLNGAAAASVVSQLRADGFTGQIIAYSSIGVGVLSGLGASANGVVWPSDWIAPGTTATSIKFAASFQKAYGVTATNYSAESFDSMYFIAYALKLAGTTNQVKLKNAMTTVGEKGFNGVLSNGIKVIDGQEIASARLAVWVNGAAAILK